MPRTQLGICRRLQKDRFLEVSEATLAVRSAGTRRVVSALGLELWRKAPERAVSASGRRVTLPGQLGPVLTET